METILQHQEFLQNYVKAMSSILEVDVTIVDRNMVRVAGTGIYSKTIGVKISDDSFFRAIIDKEKFGIIEDVSCEDHCNQCAKRSSCRELANLGYPIIFKGHVIGVIGVVAFDQEQRTKLLEKSKNLEEFLKQMSLLLESKLAVIVSNSELQDQLDRVINVENETLKRHGIIGENKKIREILRFADKISESESTVMINGESGTGKEVLAKYIHSRSDRYKNMMVSINCAAIPEALVESELFGYEGGAFTGAKKEGHKGKFEIANGSTIFLDEIGDMPLSVQAKLLRVLQERKIQRVGGKASIPIDVRVICATNKNIEQLVNDGKFREDLYYRLNVIPFTIPSLRERKEDIPLFIDFFIKEFNKKMKKNILGMSKEAQKIFVDYDWPGNIRELKNVIEYLENVVEEKYIGLEHLPLNLYKKMENDFSDKTLQNIMEEYEKFVLGKLLKTVSTLAEKDNLAKKLGISRATLYRKLNNYDL